ncbi:MAG: TetR/AcrR family transcriptional regulator [Planctomyces sp.]|nr:TetR/AcrR family transcriptional regulator [Planctomyces sp.]
MAGAETRDRICEAAIRLSSRDGLLSMTLDNVAREAGISKGGVMYHFRSKDELIQGVLSYFCEQCEQMMMRRVVDDPDPRMRWARCLVGCMFPDDSQAVETSPLSSDMLGRFMLAMLAGAVNCPDAMEPLRQLATRMRTRMLADPQDGYEQLLVWLAIDGLFLWQFMGVISENDPLMQEIGAKLKARVASHMSHAASGVLATAPGLSATEPGLAATEPGLAATEPRLAGTEPGLSETGSGL